MPWQLAESTLTLGLLYHKSITMLRSTAFMPDSTHIASRIGLNQLNAPEEIHYGSALPRPPFTFNFGPFIARKHFGWPQSIQHGSPSSMSSIPQQHGCQKNLWKDYGVATRRCVHTHLILKDHRWPLILVCQMKSAIQIYIIPYQKLQQEFGMPGLPPEFVPHDRIAAAPADR